jgi:hypothetical protein
VKQNVEFDNSVNPAQNRGRPFHCTEARMTSVCRNLKRYKLVALACASVGFFSFGSAEAQDLDPRRYINLPIDQNFVRFAYGYSEGDVNIAPSLPLEDAVLTLNAGSLAYLRTLDIGGKAASFDAYLPYVCASGNAVLNGERAERDICGQGDAMFRLSYLFFGAAAMELSEFVKAEKEVVVGASVQVSMPTGQYNDDYLLNIGANRWVVRPEIGVSVPWGKWNFEFSAGARFFTDNDDFVDDVTLEQDPLYNLQLHLVYDLTHRQWLSLNGNYFFGGVTYQNGIEQPNRQENSRVGLTWAIALNQKNVLKLTAHRGVITRVGNDSDTLSVAWIYRWD